MIQLYFDMEFTGLHKNTTPISLGIVSGDAKNEFYAEFTDYDINQCDKWIIDNVLNNLILSNRGIGIIDEITNEKMIRKVRGNKKIVSKALNDWLNQFEDQIQFISDVSHYDFVLLIDIITNGGSALDLNKNISPCCHDINHDIAEDCIFSDRKAFDLERESYITDEDMKDIRAGIIGSFKHNSLYDARIIRKIHTIVLMKKLEHMINMVTMHN